MPYYEFAHRDRLTDDRWKAMLDSEARPAIPGWIRPIVGTGGIGAPDTLRPQGGFVRSHPRQHRK